VSDQDVQQFSRRTQSNLGLRSAGMFWSAAIGASTERCIRYLSKLYDRALRQHAHVVGIATEDLQPPSPLLRAYVFFSLTGLKTATPQIAPPTQKPAVWSSGIGLRELSLVASPQETRIFGNNGA